MPRIKCHYVDCVFLDDGFCGAAAIELDPDEGCLTYSPADGAAEDAEWDEEDEAAEWDEEDADGDEDWLDEEDEF
ncbi:MAG: hypothetical protein LC099_04355 [Anaerolineales bacterium]|nr:hypothetical protein [Anaerolineales bacterium]